MSIVIIVCRYWHYYAVLYRELYMSQEYTPVDCERLIVYV